MLCINGVSSESADQRRRDGNEPGIVRRAEVSDLLRLGPLAGEFYVSSVFLKRFELSRFVGLWTQLLESGMGVMFLMDVAGESVGALGAMKYPEPYGGELIATEMFWFVHPEHRGGGLSLLDAFEDWAKSEGCREIRMVHLLDSMPDKLSILYRRRGYKAAEVHHVKDLSTWQ